ncbi:MAG TPA: pyridoxal-phosphate dependent enzyme [Chitinophagaceae bacterium]|nr:pyridoxal-phosphate dependent enzyme [Chitinophagaceae bacterium]
MAINKVMDFVELFENNMYHHPLVITELNDPLFIEKKIRIDILRLDLIHPQISGNKWFKLKYNIQEAVNQNASSILSFGGAYSNHLHALAYAGNLMNFKTIGFIRGEEVRNETLDDCRKWGMELHFVSRSEYRKRYDAEYLLEIQEKFKSSLIVPEGGNNEAGHKGAKEILKGIDLKKYSHISTAIGTGATLTGLIETSFPMQELIGFVAIKHGEYLEEEIKKNTKNKNWKLMYQYHYGGFAKTTPELVSFIHDFNNIHQIELDYVYTGKMMKAIFEMANENYFTQGSSLLFIHTGGLQGNRSFK